MSGAALLTQKNKDLRAANQRLQQKKQQKRRYIQTEDSLLVQEAQQLILQQEQADQVPAQQSRQRVPPTCSRCEIQEHTIRTCNLVQQAS